MWTNEDLTVEHEELDQGRDLPGQGGGGRVLAQPQQRRPDAHPQVPRRHQVLGRPPFDVVQHAQEVRKKSMVRLRKLVQNAAGKTTVSSIIWRRDTAYRQYKTHDLTSFKCFRSGVVYLFTLMSLCGSLASKASIHCE